MGGYKPAKTLPWTNHGCLNHGGIQHHEGQDFSNLTPDHSTLIVTPSTQESSPTIHSVGSIGPSPISAKQDDTKTHAQDERLITKQCTPHKTVNPVNPNDSPNPVQSYMDNDIKLQPTGHLIYFVKSKY